MFRDGHFHVNGEEVVLTVPKGPPAAMLEQRRPELEQVLTAHFARPIAVRLAIDPAAAPVSPTEPSQEDEPVDVHELEDAPAAGSGVERLAEAFPGAELVDEERATGP